MIRMPRLLDGSLREVARLNTVKLTLHQRLHPLSAAEMILPDGEPEIALRDLVELYDENGSAGIFRVREISADVGRTRTVHLEHGFAALQDDIIPAQGFMADTRETLSRLLACQSQPRWALGDVEAPDDLTIIFATEYTNLLAALETLLGMLPEGYALDFDQRVTPWLLHLRRLPDEPLCEGRMSRNAAAVHQQLDSSRLCTRVYPFGAELDTGRINLVPLSGSDHLDSDAAQQLGIISRTFQHDLIFDVPTLDEVARLYLSRHKEPEALLTIQAADLSAMTGLSLDAFRPGKICRICLPDHGMVLQERIIAIDKPDVFGVPGQAVLTLSNRLKIQSEQAELDDLVRQVTAGKLLGGTVLELTDRNYAHGAVNAPIVHRFDVEDYAAILDVRIQINPNAGVSIQAVRVDSVLPEEAEWRSGSFSLMPCLTRDALGQIARGEHRVSISPTNGAYGESCGVESIVTLTVIEKTVT